MNAAFLAIALAAASPDGPAKNEITTTRYVVGGSVGTAIGFGIGHAIQRRSRDHGILITVAEAGGLVAAVFGGLSLRSTESQRQSADLLLYAGVLTYVGTRFFEIYDVWAGPRRAGRYFRVGPAPISEGRATRPGLGLSVSL